MRDGTIPGPGGYRPRTGGYRPRTGVYATHRTGGYARPRMGGYGGLHPAPYGGVHPGSDLCSHPLPLSPCHALNTSPASLQTLIALVVRDYASVLSRYMSTPLYPLQDSDHFELVRCLCVEGSNEMACV